MRPPREVPVQPLSLTTLNLKLVTPGDAIVCAGPLTVDRVADSGQGLTRRLLSTEYVNEDALAAGLPARQELDEDW